MITNDNFEDLLIHLGFQKKGNAYTKHFSEHDCVLAADMKATELSYPESKGMIINERQTCDFSQNENFVVFECVHRLLEQGYKPESIELEPKWKVGHGASGGRADILIKNRENEPLLIIECKNAGKEFNKAWKDTLEDGAQLFTYIEQEKAVEYVALYASDFESNQITTYQRIISHKDNEKVLSEHASLKSFKDSNNVKERYKVWRDTYKLEFTEKGLFEDNIQPYQIGKEKYTLEIDTKTIDASDKRGKYHQFRTILRKYNVSRRENAFEVLVNLFLCKIVDETENPNDLKFYWKGIAYDNYYDLVDRLQALYKTGMDKFLKQDIVYISNQDIDNAFWTMKQERNATKSTIKEIFRQLKFFKGLDFDFIKVHNKSQFEKNAKILLEMIQMWQGLRLLSAGQNQFLGDMFEFFLDNGIKQSEGQFFTPVPICKFIVASLPLERKIIESNEPIRAIDYACGSGHFLNEFASSITPYVRKHKKVNLSNYYQNITGIEKEDRLAKVAKVSAFMYGQDQINIIEQDALKDNEQVKASSYDCLVANPPFSVEDFLLTLDEEVRDGYELTSTINDLSNKNIQCFFLERAKQLLAPNGVTGIVVPAPILSIGDSTHIKTREILLMHFDIVSIVELGNGTFGKTGTPTVILFMRRKAHKPSQAEHFSNRLNDFFEDWEKEKTSGGGAYSDTSVVENYCEKQGIEFTHYESLLNGEYSKELFTNDLFSDYEKSFYDLATIKKLIASKSFRAKTKESQEEELTKRLITWVIEKEKDKLYYFMLATNNPQKVLVVRSPSDKKNIKDFLGYEWSGAKGSEGIKYNDGETIYDIKTPLYNPNDTKDSSKINSLISDNFEGKKLSIPNELSGIVSSLNLHDMIDFSRVEFNKALNLSAKGTSEIEELFKSLSKSGGKTFRLSDKDSFEVSIGKRVLEKEIGTDSSNGIAVYSANVHEPFGYINKNLLASFEKPSVLWGIDGDWMVNFLEKDIPFYPTDHCGVIRVISKDLNPIYLAWALKKLGEANSFSRSNRASSERIKGLRITAPDIKIQNRIAEECKSIDAKVADAKTKIKEHQTKMDEVFQAADAQASIDYRLNNKDIFDIAIGKRVLKKEVLSDAGKGIPIYSANVFKPFGFINKELLINFDKPSVLWGIDGDWMVNCLEKDIPFYPTDHCGVLRVKNDALNTKYVALVLNKAGTESRFSRSNRASTARIKGLTISVPDISIQNKAVEEIKVLEKIIDEAHQLIINSAKQKESIFEKHLKV